MRMWPMRAFRIGLAIGVVAGAYAGFLIGISHHP